MFICDLQLVDVVVHREVLALPGTQRAGAVEAQHEDDAVLRRCIGTVEGERAAVEDDLFGDHGATLEAHGSPGNDAVLSAPVAGRRPSAGTA